MLSLCIIFSFIFFSVTGVQLCIPQYYSVPLQYKLSYRKYQCNLFTLLVPSVQGPCIQISLVV